MAFIFQINGTPNSGVNLTPATGAIAVFNVKEGLKQAGWTVKASSDGTTYNATGDQITTGAAGAGGMANNNAWFRIQSPAGPGGREFTFQRGTTNLVWRAKVSHSAGFSTPAGTPASQTPSAADQQIYAGGGTDASPSFLSWLATDNTYKQHIGCDAAAPYDAYCVLMPTGGLGDSRRWTFFNMAAGTYPDEDVAPWLVDMNNAAATGANLESPTPLNTRGLGQGYYRKGFPSGEGFTAYATFGWQFGNSKLVPRNEAYGFCVGANPYTGTVDLIPLPILRVSGQWSMPGMKGYLRTDVIAFASVIRKEGSYFDRGSSRYLVVDEVCLIFPQAVTPSV
jgi:hypothetical protein